MVTFLVGAISIATVFLFGCVGEIITEKSGQLNLGIPGLMCMGASGGSLGISIYMQMCDGNPAWILLILFAIVFSAIFSAFGSLIYGFLTVSLRANQNVTGLALTTFGGGISQFVFNQYINTSALSQAGPIIKKALPFADNLGWFGQIFLGHGIFVYLAIAIAILTSVVLNKKRVGLQLRAVGENPATADAVGINVTKYKYLAIIIGGVIAGFGGVFYSLDYCKGMGVLESTPDIQAFGWLAIALVIFTVWKPNLSILGSFVFGALYILAYQGFSFNQQILKLLPYIITVIVLIFTSVFGSKSVQPPASLGLNYFREER